MKNYTIYETTKNNITNTATNMEQHIINALLREKKIARFNRPVSIHIHSIRNRYADTDGLCAKYVIDSLVSVGVLSDDRKEEVQSITYTQEKTKGKEETIIIIEEI